MTLVPDTGPTPWSIANEVDSVTLHDRVTLSPAEMISAEDVKLATVGVGWLVEFTTKPHPVNAKETKARRRQLKSPMPCTLALIFPPGISLATVLIRTEKRAAPKTLVRAPRQIWSPA